MGKSFTAKQLSDALEIAIAKWKRWAREFIGIDPVAGRFGGVSREFSEEQAFHVYLAGVLVSELFFSIPDAKAILSILNPWLKERGIWPGTEPKKTGTAWDIITGCKVYIVREIKGGFCFQLEGRIRERPIKYHGYKAQEVTFIEEPLVPPIGTVSYVEHPNVQRVLDVSDIKVLFDFKLKMLKKNT